MYSYAVLNANINNIWNLTFTFQSSTTRMLISLNINELSELNTPDKYTNDNTSLYLDRVVHIRTSLNVWSATISVYHVWNKAGKAWEESSDAGVWVKY